MRNILSYFIILAASLTLTACVSGGYDSVDSVGGLAGGEIQDTSVSLDDSSFSTDTDTDTDSTNLLNHRAIYFEYDSTNLTSESKEIVRAHAQYLINTSGVGVTLEGHGDERGTREYNLALGENRAKSVSKLMQASGLSSGRIQVISYGEERPASLGSDANAWRLNRRVEILY